MRWMILAGTLAALAGCKKETAAQTPPQPAPITTEPTAAEDPPGAAADPGAAEPAMGGITGDQVGEQPAAARIEGPQNKDMVAVSSSGKSKVIATGSKTVADSESYTVKLASPDKVAKGAKAAATLEIVPKKGWHLNEEFPYKLTVAAPAGAKVAKPEQSKKDTVSFSQQSMKWSIDFEASSGGDKAFTGKVKFAVCTETSCDPKKEELAFNVKVE